MSNVSKSWWISFLILAAVCLGYYINTLYKTDFHYTYFIDDAYIHLAIAKNFALHQVWGVTSHQFSSSSSAPFYTFLLSIFISLFGNNDQLPLYVNLFFGIGVIYFLNKYYSAFFKDAKSVICAVLFTVFFAVLHLQLLSGMEHLLHILLIVMNIFCLNKLNQNKKYAVGFYITILLMGLVRFESMFYFAALAFCLILMRKWKVAAIVILTGFIPIAVFCYFNYQQDGYLFPNSVVIKGAKLSFDSHFFARLKTIVFDNFLFNISFYKVGFFPILMCAVFLFRDFKKQSFDIVVKRNFLLTVFSLLMIGHSLFADLKGGFRYEAYILTGFSMALIPKTTLFFQDFKAYIKKERLISFLILINFSLMIYKLIISHMVLNDGGKNIHEQQVQSAKFLHQYYNQSKVVANDIGAITYYTDIHLFDIAGLASKEMIPFNENKAVFDDRFEIFLTEFSTKNQYDLAVVYEVWFGGRVPKSWKKVATLKIKNKITVAQDEVAIYCINLENLDLLTKNIQDFKWDKNVKVDIVE
ncbi:hypothetical protein K0U91_04705 [Chryseobacterium chendengshani]|uniref:hypothetical protein n=1 Tax=Chryseobacterium sp. LJ668 TaxID=2864040 RepID=UPI001C68D1B4|nr:hypothetical protein [Chryseobacterium sp. LJ668]MBW8521767.1 hypothetical protein [Chryseobacterium sp. LJ668]QYK17431.1 hypothetical protein K0U91_04705 [Chryseobacterium sp. LJ668]